MIFDQLVGKNLVLGSIMLGSNERQIYAFSLRRLMVNTQIHVFEHRPVLTKKLNKVKNLR